MENLPAQKTAIALRIQKAARISGTSIVRVDEALGIASPIVRLLAGFGRYPSQFTIDMLALLMGVNAHWLATGQTSPGAKRVLKALEDQPATLDRVRELVEML